MHFKSGSIPKKGPLRIYGLIDVSGSIPLLGLSSPDLKSILTPIDFFSGNLVIWHPSHGKDWVDMHFKSGRSTPKKGPLRIYGLRDVSGSIPLFRSI